MKTITAESNFRIVAFRTGNKQKSQPGVDNGSEGNFLKNLKPNTIYKFYHNFDFPNDDFSRIDCFEENHLDLFRLDAPLHKMSIKINAVVGSNGAGKSTLLDLLNYAVYNIGTVLGFLKDNEGSFYLPHKSFEFELFYQTETNRFFIFKFRNGQIHKQLVTAINGKLSCEGPIQRVSKREEITEFFFSVIINYSHYALNSSEIGDWIDPLFHKNDGYQTPIVLNPMRTKGDFEINKEIHLLTRRLIANLLEPLEKKQPKNSLRNVGNGKIAFSLTVAVTSIHLKNGAIPDGKKLYKDLLSGLQEHFRLTISWEEYTQHQGFAFIGIDYIFDKLIKIASTYTKYRKYAVKFGPNNSRKSIQDVKTFLKDVKDDISHVTYKIKGAILYVLFFKDIFGISRLDFEPKMSGRGKGFDLSIEDLSNKIENLRPIVPFPINTFMMAPPSVFQVEIVLESGGQFSSLSSGEKQRIHSISSVVYHLTNLNSVEEQRIENLESLSYKYINIVLDEIELYYHPEWQRRYLADLLDYIGKVNPEKLNQIRGLNITFLTHSPYIISDLPANNVMILERVEELGFAVQRVKDRSETFASNIHTLLADSFFLKTGLIGEYAKQKIERLIKQLSDEDTPSSEKEDMQLLIDIIGDPLLKKHLQNLWDDKFLDENLVRQRKIQRLREEIKQLGGGEK